MIATGCWRWHSSDPNNARHTGDGSNSFSSEVSYSEMSNSNAAYIALETEDELGMADAVHA